MTDYSAKEIYHFARLAGFTPDQAVTMTAIALAESGGESKAHNPDGEDSRGLWQINVNAHPQLANSDLYDPMVNAQAAFAISARGRNVAPWTTTHGGTSAPYGHFKNEAIMAARQSGDPTANGNFVGTPSYDVGLPASDDGIAATGPTDVPTTTSAENNALQTFLQSALAQKGDPYVYGAPTASPSDPDPDVFDCSELVRWSAARAGVDLPDGSWQQYLTLKAQGLTISPEEAEHTPGALLFSFSSEPTPTSGRPDSAHVAISLGNGKTIEAANPDDDVTSFSAAGRFQYAAIIPGISDGTATALTEPLTVAPSGDTDGDQISDSREAVLGTSSTSIDTDNDHISDDVEIFKLETDPTKADSDSDGTSDSMELVAGTSPGDPDSNRDGVMDGERRAHPADSDSDGITDVLERVLGSDIHSGDSDQDGYGDLLEYQSEFDPADPASNPTAPATSDPVDATLGSGVGDDDPATGLGQ
jgi:cell wall-associated NlpC family hydrolase